MPSKYIKKGWNPNSGKNIKLAPHNQAHELGIPRKSYHHYYVPKGFNENSLRNLDRTGKGAKGARGTVSNHPEC